MLYISRANPHFYYKLSNTPLSFYQYVRDLEVTVSSGLTYHKHIESLVTIAMASVSLKLSYYRCKTKVLYFYKEILPSLKVLLF